VDRSVVTSTQNTIPGAPVSAQVKAVKQGTLANFSYTNPGGGSTFDFTNQSQRASSYLWDFGDGMTSTEPNPSHTFHSGKFNVKLTASNPCTSDSATQSLTVTGTTIYLPVVIKLP
jgi:PKD repeat protein